MDYGTVYDKAKGKTTLSNLRSVAPETGEISGLTEETVSYVRTETSEHDDCLSEFITQFSSGGDIYTDYEEVNTKFSNLIDTLATAYDENTKADDNGTVSTGYTGNGGGGYSSSSSSSDSSSS